jgi:hypothetical protein
VFKDGAAGFAVPLWTLDDSVPQLAAAWRYPER